MALDLTTRRFMFLDVAMKYGVWSRDTRPTSFYDAVNFTKLEFEPPKQKIARVSSRMDGSVGQALAVVNRPTGEPATVAAEFDAAPVNFIALALGATVSELDVDAKTVTDTAVTTVLGLWVPLPDQWITAASFTLETDGGVGDDVLIAATKYELDAINGLIKATDAAAVGSKIASYTVAATAGEVYAAGKALSADIYLVGTGTEQASKRRCRIIVERAALAAGGKIDLAKGEAIAGSLAGELATPSDRTAPWTYTYSDLVTA